MSSFFEQHRIPFNFITISSALYFSHFLAPFCLLYSIKKSRSIFGDWVSYRFIIYLFLFLKQFFSKVTLSKNLERKTSYIPRSKLRGLPVIKFDLSASCRFTPHKSAVYARNTTDRDEFVAPTAKKSYHKGIPFCGTGQRVPFPCYLSHQFIAVTATALWTNKEYNLRHCESSKTDNIYNHSSISLWVYKFF